MMQSLISALLLTACMNFGVLLRYGPFRQIVSVPCRKLLFALYGAFAVANIIIITVFMNMYGINFAFDYLRYGGIIYAVLLSLVNILVIKKRWREHLFVFGIVLTCNYLLMTVPNFVVSRMPQVKPDDFLYVVLGVFFVLLILTFFPMMKMLQHTVAPFIGIDAGDYWRSVWFLPLMYFAARYITLGGEHNTGGYGQLISSLFTAAFMIAMCLKVASDYKKITNRLLLEKQIDVQKEHYAKLSVGVEHARKTRHDLKHHMAAILHFIETDDKEGARNYSEDLLTVIGMGERVPFTGNTAVDGVLYHYMQRATEQNIDINCVGTVRSSGIADIDLCVLFGNALDNAVTACLNLEQGRKIHIICQSEKKLLSIVIQNSFDGKVQQGKKGLYSRKRDNSYGVGMASMRSVCERYGGSFDVSWDENTFSVMFILPLAD